MKKTNYKTKRLNGEGSVFQKPNGKWIAQATLGRDENGKPMRKSFQGDTADEAIAKRAQALSTMFGSPVVKHNINPSKARFLDLYKHFMMKHYINTVSSKTFKNRLDMASRIDPHFKYTLFKDVSKESLQNYFNFLRDEKKLHVNYVRKYRSHFALFYDYCKDESKIIKDNYARETSVYNVHKQLPNSYKPLSLDTAVKFFTALYADEDKKFLQTLCMAIYFGGPRIGETLAIQWKKFDFDRRVTTVDQAINIDYKFDEDGKVVERANTVGTTKTIKGNRETPITEILYECLIEYRDHQKDREKKVKRDYTSLEQFVFCNREGKMRTYSGTRKIFRRFLQKHKIENLGICFHALRKTTSQVLFEAMRTATEVQSILGHADPTTTQKHYNVAGVNTMTSVRKDLEEHGKLLFSKIKPETAEQIEEREKIKDDEMLDYLLTRYSPEDIVTKLKKKKDFEM